MFYHPLIRSRLVRWQRTCLFLICLVGATANAARAQETGRPDSLQALLLEAYREQDLAWNIHSAQDEIKWYGPVFEDVDEKGHVEVQDKAQQLAAARHDVRTPGSPNMKYFPRQITVLKKVFREGNSATASRVSIKELTTVSPEGTVVHIRFTMTVEDKWVLRPEGWREVRSHLLKNDVFESATPSPSIMAAIEHMKALNGEIHSFNSAINFSQCMNAVANQKYDYDLRRDYCGR